MSFGIPRTRTIKQIWTSREPRIDLDFQAPTLTPVRNWVLKATSPVDPSVGVTDASGTLFTTINDTHDALKTDQMAIVYNKLQVKKARLTVHFHSNATAPVCDIVGIAAVDDVKQLAVPGHYQEACPHIVAPITAGGVRTLSLEVDVAKYHGLTPKLLAADDQKRYHGFPGGATTLLKDVEDPIYFHIFVQQNRSADYASAIYDHDIECFCTIEYEVMYSDPKSMVQST